MAIYDGFVSTDDGDVHVIVAVDERRLTMSAGGSEIGDWPISEVEVTRVGEGVYTITAEDESLRFTPKDPVLFGLYFKTPEPSGPPVAETTTEPAVDPDDAGGPDAPEAPAVPEAPPPRPVTRVLFYALAVVTVALGLWAMGSILL